MALWQMILMRRCMDSLFIDTWGWLTLRDKDQKRHKETSMLFYEHVSQKKSVYTSDYVLDETFTLLFKRLPLVNALSSMDLLLKSLESNEFQLEWIFPERFHKVCDLRKRFQDKPGISFTDLTSIVVMQELGIRNILTGDAHFSHIGFGFNIVPG